MTILRRQAAHNVARQQSDLTYRGSWPIESLYAGRSGMSGLLRACGEFYGDGEKLGAERSRTRGTSKRSGNEELDHDLGRPRSRPTARTSTRRAARKAKTCSAAGCNAVFFYEAPGDGCDATLRALRCIRCDACSLRRSTTLLPALRACLDLPRTSSSRNGVQTIRCSSGRGRRLDH
jgi:hypothetical protein